MTLIELFGFIDSGAVNTIEFQFEQRFMQNVDKKIRDANPATDRVIVEPFESFSLVNSTDDRFDYRYSRKFNVTWVYAMQGTYDNRNGQVSFEFEVVSFVKENPGYYSTPQIIDPIQRKLLDVQALREKITTEHQLYNYDSCDLPYFKPTFLAKFSTVCGLTKPLKEFDSHVFSTDLIHSADYLALTLSETELLSHYLYNFKTNRMPHGTEYVFRYFPTLYDHRFFMLAEHYIQLQYNHWSKLGNLLDCYFETGLNKREINFIKVIDAFPEKFHDDNYTWLLEFKKDTYSKLNSARKEVVHYSGQFSDTFQSWLKNNTDEEAISRLQKKQDDMLIELKHFHNQVFIGTEKVLKLIEKEKETAD